MFLLNQAGLRSVYDTGTGTVHNVNQTCPKCHPWSCFPKHTCYKPVRLVISFGPSGFCQTSDCSECSSRHLCSRFFFKDKLNVHCAVSCDGRRAIGVVCSDHHESFWGAAAVGFNDVTYPSALVPLADSLYLQRIQVVSDWRGNIRCSHPWDAPHTPT